MTRTATRHTNNVIIGAGELYLDLFNAAGAKTGERYLGDAGGARLAITTEETTVFSGTGAVAQELARVIRQITREFGLTLRDMSMENMALFVIGDLAAGKDVADEVIAVEAGKSYQLGVSAGNPAGYSRVSGVIVTGGTVNGAGRLRGRGRRQRLGRRRGLPRRRGLRAHLYRGHGQDGGRDGGYPGGLQDGASRAIRDETDQGRVPLCRGLGLG